MEFKTLKYNDGLELMDTIPNQQDSTIYQSKQFLELYHKSQYFRIYRIADRIQHPSQEVLFCGGI